jgi:hypothetical protein
LLSFYYYCDQVLTREYSRLPVFEGTEVPSGKTTQKQIDEPHNINSSQRNGITNSFYVPPTLAEMADVFTLFNPLGHKDAELNPLGTSDNYAIDERVKQLLVSGGGSSRPAEYLSGHVRGGPVAQDMHDLLESVRSCDSTVLSQEINCRIRARSLMRLQLAVTRQNNVKVTEKLSTAKVTGSKTTFNSVSAPERIFGVARATALSPSPRSDKEVLNEMLLCAGIISSVATVDGLITSPYFVPAADNVLRSLVELLSSYIDDMQPFPLTHPCSLFRLPRGDGGTSHSNSNPSSGTKYPNFQPLTVWDRALSNTSLTFGSCDGLVVRAGSVSSFPAAFSKPVSGQCSLNIILTEAKISNNWLTVGVCSTSFPNSSSDGFGKQSSSW